MEITKKLKVATFLVFLLFMVGGGYVHGGDTIGEQCGDEFTKVTACLTFATGKAETPTKECCGSVTEIKEKEPVCLCYVIQQINNGSNTLKGMGIQEARLLQLPSACKLTNASVSDCPKLLHLPANSPDSAIFTNASTATTTTNPISTTGSTPTPSGSIGFKPLPKASGPIVVAAVIFLCAFPPAIGPGFLA